MKKIVLYSSNSKRRDSNSQCTVFPKWADQWDEMASRHPDYDITLVVQLNGRYFMDIYDGNVAKMPKNIHVEIMDMEDKLDQFVEKIKEINPEIAISMPGPVSGYDWNGIRDAVIAEELNRSGIKAICYPVKTALDTFDKWRTHCVLKENGFPVADCVYIHHEMFFAGQNDVHSTGNVYQEYALSEVKNMDMPVVIKCTTGSSSMGIYIAKTYEDAREYLLSENNKEDVIVEQFLKGEEFGTEVHGMKGNYSVLPPFRLYSTGTNELNDPLGLTTVKYGPILDEKYHVEEIQETVRRMAELMDFAGSLQVDLMFVNDKWYIIEINSRWSGMTTLMCGAEGRLPYDIYVDQIDSNSKNYSNPKNLKFACQFKMGEASTEVLEEVSKEPGISSVIQYEVIRPERPKFVFSDVVISGFDTLEQLIDGLESIQKKYPEQIAEQIVTSLKERS